MTGTADLLLCDLTPYRHSTRTRKIAAAAAHSLGGRVHAITLARVGREGTHDDPGTSRADGVDVEQVHVRGLDDRRRFTASVRNLVMAYIPAVWRLRRRVLATPARTIFIGHMALLWLGLAHQRRWGSRIVVSGRERPGGIRTKGSLATWFSRIEPWALRLAARRRDFAVLAVCDSHALQFRDLGVKDVIVVRNVPAAVFAPEFVPPPPGPDLIVACVGSLFPGRGIEALIDAVVAARKGGAPVRLEITGRAGTDYAAALRRHIDVSGASGYVSLEGPCAPDGVASRYQRAHVGTALYESVDAANDSLSNKLFESVVAGRPVLAGDLSENRSVIRRYGVGWTSAVDANSLSAALTYLAGDLHTVASMAPRCHQIGQAEFVWEVETRLLQERLLAGHPA